MISSSFNKMFDCFPEFIGFEFMVGMHDLGSAYPNFEEGVLARVKDEC